MCGVCEGKLCTPSFSFPQAELPALEELLFVGMFLSGLSVYVSCVAVWGMYVYTHTCTPISVHTHLYTHTCTPTPVHPHLYTHTCTPTSVHTHTCTHTPLHPHLYTHICTPTSILSHLYKDLRFLCVDMMSFLCR